MMWQRLNLVLQAGVFCLWSGAAHAVVCDFGDFVFHIDRNSEGLQVTDAGERRLFRPIGEEQGYWFALGYSDHGKEAAYLAFHDRQVVLSVHSIGQILVSETFRGTCDGVTGF